MKYVLGTIIIAIGFLVTWKAEWIVQNAGRIPWAEKHLGSDGGTRLFYKLLGLAAIILSFMYMGGILQAILSNIFGSSADSLNN